MQRPLVLGVVTLAVLAGLPAVPAAAAFPGRPARLAFSRSTPAVGLGEIYTVTATGGGALNLTGTPLVEDTEPTWSPDGKRIALRRTGAGPDQLWTMDSTGGALAVVPGSGAAAAPAWSPDGKRLVYECWSTQTNEREICARNVDGTGFQLLTATVGADEGGPVWSPDGTRIVFSREFAGGAFLLSLQVQSLSLNPVTAQVAGTYDRRADWSPDGGELAFTRFVSGSGNGGAVYRMPSAGGPATLVTAPMPGSDSHHTMPAWSPDGKKIAYVHLDDDQAWGHIYVINPDGTGNTQITSGKATTDMVPDWRAG
jgi:Tol biopolymer transport system component